MLCNMRITEPTSNEKLRGISPGNSSELKNSVGQFSKSSWLVTVLDDLKETNFPGRKF